MQVFTVEDVMVTDPRWSWYGTPLRNCPAVCLTIQSYTMGAVPPGVGSFTTADFSNHIAEYRLYFTQEEYVMWKLHGYDQQRYYDLAELRKGTVYG